MIKALGDPEMQRTMTAEAAKFWYETILNLPFVREAPLNIRAGGQAFLLTKQAANPAGTARDEQAQRSQL